MCDGLEEEPLKQALNRAPRPSYLPPKRENQVVTFRLGTEVYGVNIEKVKEVVNLQELHPAPEGPKFIEGTIELREAIVPVIDLRKRFGISVGPAPKPRVFVLLDDSRLRGVIVDDFANVLVLDSRQCEAVPHSLMEDKKTTYVDTMATTENDVIMIISPAGLLSHEEDAELKKFEDSLGKERSQW
jgi:purine-binding chemotaxis protein CheW